MEFKKLIKYFFVCASVYFTALGGALLVILTILTTGSDTMNGNMAVEPSRFLLLLAFCFTMALGSTVRRARISSAIGWVCNAVCYVGGFFAFLLISELELEAALVLTAVFVCIYAPVCLLVAFLEKKKRRAELIQKAANATANTGKKQKNSPKKKADPKTDSVNQDGTPYQNLFS